MKLAILSLVLALLLIACSSPETPKTQDTADQANTQTAPAEETKAQADASNEFNAYFAKRNLQWKIAYDLKSNAQGEQTTMQMTQYMKGEQKLRTDVTAQGMESQIYIVNEVYTMCTKSDGSWSCFKSEPSKDDAVTTEKWEESYEEDATKYDIVADGTKVVAGVTAKCFKVVEVGKADAVVRYCFSSDGAPLYMYFADSESSSEMIATSYSKSVSDSEFIPPAEAKDISAMYGGAGGTSPAGGDACSYCNYLSGTDKDECLASC
jgi:hypothetical protein